MSTNNNDPTSKAGDNSLEVEGYTVSQSYFLKAIRYW
jgi:hypothetical protein